MMIDIQILIFKPPLPRGPATSLNPRPVLLWSPKNTVHRSLHDKTPNQDDMGMPQLRSHHGVTLRGESRITVIVQSMLLASNVSTNLDHSVATVIPPRKATVIARGKTIKHYQAPHVSQILRTTKT
jgi:hypothetical protein